MKNFRSIISILIIFSMLSVTAEAKKIKLEYDLKPGDQFKLELVQQQDTEQEVMGQVQHMSTELTAQYDFKVISADKEGKMSLEVLLSRFAFKMQNPMMEFTFDSAKEEEIPQYGRPFMIVLNEVFTFNLDRLGNVSALVAPDGLEAKVMQEMMSLDGMDAQLLAGIAGSLGSAEQMNTTLGGLFMKMPVNKIEPGETWKEEGVFNQMIAFKTTSTYKLAGTSKNGSEIALAVQITQADPNLSMPMEGMTMSYELAGDKSGKILLEPNGLVQTSESVTVISGIISVESPQLPAPMSIPITAQAVDRIRRL